MRTCWTVLLASTPRAPLAAAQLQGPHCWGLVHSSCAHELTHAAGLGSWIPGRLWPHYMRRSQPARGPSTQARLCVQGNLSASTTKASQLYTLSVNRLAPQQHAQLAVLNASVNGTDFTLCSDGSTLAAVPVLDAATGTGSPTGVCPALACTKLNALGRPCGRAQTGALQTHVCG